MGQHLGFVAVDAVAYGPGAADHSLAVPEHTASVTTAANTDERLWVGRVWFAGVA
jgi:hypothetical protein